MSRTPRIGFVMDPIETINPKKDTTLAIMVEAQRRGWDVTYITTSDLSMRGDVAYARMHTVDVQYDPTSWYQTLGSVLAPLHDLDVVMMRKDPPFDMEYVVATYILEAAERHGTRVVNRARSIRDANEKVYTNSFPNCSPPSIITRSKTDLRSFLEEHGAIVLKPLNKMGGRSVFVIHRGDPNTNVIIEEVSQYGAVYVQAQQYLPAIKDGGDKRIILINGIPVEGAIARLPSADDHRGNLAVGATASGVPLSDRDRWLCEQLRPDLQERGLHFVGIDVIGDYVTEINVTSPTGVREIEHFFGINVPALLLDSLCLDRA